MPCHSRPAQSILAAVLALAAAVPVRLAAQTPCSRAWVPLEGSPGAAWYGAETSIVWDPDGSGPLPPRVVVGGAFHAVGSMPARGIAQWDPATNTWSQLGAGVDGIVYALAVLPTGELAVVGNFESAGGLTFTRHAARWSGTSWQRMGQGLGQAAHSLTTLPNGHVIATGPCGVVRWNGFNWVAWSTALASAAAALPNGDLVAGGYGTFGGNQFLARWNGTSWAPFGAPNAAIESLHLLPSGDLVAAGYFTSIGGVAAHRIARWDGSTWSAMGAGVLAPSRSMLSLPNGDLLATQSNLGVSRWDGTAWNMFAVTNGAAKWLSVLPGGDLLLVGEFGSVGAVMTGNIARWNGTSWSRVVDGIDGDVHALAALPNGDWVAGGEFTFVGSLAANRIVRRSGGQWSSLGSGCNGIVRALLALPNGDVVAGGEFTLAGGVPVGNLAYWDNNTWYSIGTIAGAVRALAMLPNGDLVVGGSFQQAGGVAASNIARFDGVAWSPLGAGLDGRCDELLVLADGRLAASGRFSGSAGGAGGRPLLWDGTSWSSLAGSTTTPWISTGGLGQMLDGRIVWSTFNPFGSSAIWVSDGVQAAQISPDFAHGFVTEPTGDLVAWFSMSSTRGPHRWNGSTWTQLSTEANNDAFALIRLPNGDLVAGGQQIVLTPDQFSVRITQLTTTCPATTTSSGAGCSGAGGTNALIATSLPWLGAPFRSVATGLAGTTLALVVHGFAATNVPLSSIVPQGGAGCALLATPDLVETRVATWGQLDVTVPIPASAVLIGQTFHQQVIGLELAAGGPITSFTSTNALAATIGSL
jgi:trimeric autotransporter adhesin